MKLIKVVSTVQYDRVADFAIRNGFDKPYSTEVYFVEDEKSKSIQGVIGIDVVMKIEPLICSDKFLAYNLLDFAEKTIKDAQIPKVEIFTTDEKYKALGNMLEKLNYNFIEKTNRFVKEL